MQQDFFSVLILTPNLIAPSGDHPNSRVFPAIVLAVISGIQRIFRRQDEFSCPVNDTFIVSVQEWRVVGNMVFGIQRHARIPTAEAGSSIILRRNGPLAVHVNITPFPCRLVISGKPGGIGIRIYSGERLHRKNHSRFFK